MRLIDLTARVAAALFMVYANYALSSIARVRAGIVQSGYAFLSILFLAVCIQKIVVVSGKGGLGKLIAFRAQKGASKSTSKSISTSIWMSISSTLP
ncbi:MAG: hypothetical protein AAF065_05445 [Verrucomicrobiota bacterium]